MPYTAAISYRSGKREEMNVSLWVSVRCCVVVPLCNVASDHENKTLCITDTLLDTTSNVCEGIVCDPQVPRYFCHFSLFVFSCL